MAYNVPHLVLRAMGKFNPGGTEETWSAGFRIATPTAGGLTYDAAKLSAILAGVVTPFSTFHASAVLAAGGTCYLQQLSIARVGMDGKYDPPTQDTIYHTYPVAGVQGNGTNGLPWSTCWVCSLRTSNPRGYASNGRVYWPATSKMVDTGSGVVTSASVTAALNVWKTLILAINSSADAQYPGAAVSVMSRVGAGTHRAVTAVRMDGRLDTQERRENKIAPSYQVLSLS